MYHLIFASKAYIPNFGPAGPPHPFEKFLVVVQNKFYAKKNLEREIKKSEGLTYGGGEVPPTPQKLVGFYLSMKFFCST